MYFYAAKEQMFAGIRRGRNFATHPRVEPRIYRSHVMRIECGLRLALQGSITRNLSDFGVVAACGGSAR